MSHEDWAKKYSEMDKRLQLKYEQRPDGEQIGKRPLRPQADKNPSGGTRERPATRH